MIFIASHCTFIVAAHCYCSSYYENVLERYYPEVLLMLFITLNLLLGDMGYGNLTKQDKGVD